MKTVQTVPKRPLFDAAPTGAASAFRDWKSNSNFVVGLLNVGEKNMNGLLFRKQRRNGRRVSAFGNWKGNSNFAVNLTNVGEKNVKGLLFRKQPRTSGGFRLSEME